ncbi:MAG: TldD/PmbA family protein [Candidatus Cloacimonetes bacterium]|nr:TldD/PmbA family protein [Candidatus Cloacimonadota bacterium]
MIEKNISKYNKLFSEYTELRVQENRNCSISVVNGDIMGNNKSSESGVSARVYKKGVWGFSSNPTISDETVKDVIQAATENALYLNDRERKNKEPLPKTIGTAEKDFMTDKQRKTQKEMIDFLKEVDDHIGKTYSDLTARTTMYRCLEMEKALLTSEGSHSYSMIPRSIIYIVMSLVKDGQPFELYEVHGGFGQFEDIFDKPDDIFEKLQIQYDHLKKKSEGVYAKAGVADCIFAPDLAGILSHEAIGHTVEADIVLGGSVAADYLNKQVANPNLTMVDFANTALGQMCPIPVFVDDEGTKAEDAVLIENGILKTFMHNKESAQHFGVKPNGNARAYTYSDEPIIRMRNTAIVPGKDKLQDMIASIDDGYYLMQASNGQADSTSEFMFGIVKGYEIKNGKLGRALKDTTISGVAFDMLKTISMISDDMVWSCGGMCGKKQLIPVGMGGPAVKCKVNIGGK